jgi:acyl carrier protein
MTKNLAAAVAVVGTAFDDSGCAPQEHAGRVGLFAGRDASCLDNVRLACDSLRQALCDLALVGEAAGQGRESGRRAAAMTLRRLPEALAAGDRIRAVVLDTPAAGDCGPAGDDPGGTVSVAGLADLIEAVHAIERESRQGGADARRWVTAASGGTPAAAAALVLAAPPAPLPRAGDGRLEARGEGGPPPPRRDRPALAGAYRAPANPLEAALAAVWAERLDVDRVGVDDNFFDLGGTSLLGIEIIAVLKQWLHQEIPTVSLYDGPTVSALAGVILHGGGRAQAAYDLVRERGERRRRKLQRLARGGEAEPPGEPAR